MRLNVGDSLSAVMGGAAATTNPTVKIEYQYPLGMETGLVALTGATPVSLLAGASAATIINSITVTNVDTQSNVVTISGTIGGVTANMYVFTMAAGDSLTVDINGQVIGTNSIGQRLTQLSPANVLITLAGATDAIPPHGTASYVVNKAGVDAMTLAAPTATTDDGKVILVTSNTANAHTITATGLLQTGTASVNVATFAAQKGAGVQLIAYQGKWNVVSSVGITFS